MSPELVGFIGIALLIVLMMFRMQIGLTFMLVGLLGCLYLVGIRGGLTRLALDSYATATSYSLSVIPMFALMGMLLAHSGLAVEIYEAVDVWFGRVRGGMALATIGAGALFGAACGSGLAATATMTSVALPEMRKHGYKDTLATASIAAGGSLSVLIPPSVILVVYGVLTQEPIGLLLIAGIVPGILQSVLFMITISILVKRDPSLASVSPATSFRKKLFSLKLVWPIPILFLLAIGGIYIGVFTPTEAGAVGTFGALIVSVVSKHLSRKSLVTALDESARTTAMIFLIVIGATVFGAFLAVTRIPYELSAYIVNLGLSRYTVIAILIFIYLIMGCFMEGISIMVLTLPIVYPLIIDLGFSGIWFGPFIVVLINIGALTPPVGINAYVVSGIARDIPLQTVFRGCIPFMISMIVCCGLLVIFPQIITFLPSQMR